MPAGGSTSQTAVNRAAGARTQAAGLVTAATALATLLFLAPFVSLMPQAALAAVVVTTSIGLFKPADFVAILRVRQMEFWWAVAATCGVVLLGTLNGILVAVALSVLILFYQANRPPVYVLGRRRDTGVFEALSPGEPDIETFPSLLIMRTEGRIYFANAFRIGEQMWPLIQESRPQIVALEMSAVPDLEYTALCGLTAAETQLRENGTTLWLVALNAGVREVIERAPLGRVLGRERIFATLDQAVAAHANAAEQRSAL
jgi:MFS superfamily sulfate permease-like transporter